MVVIRLVASLIAKQSIEAAILQGLRVADELLNSYVQETSKLKGDRDDRTDSRFQGICNGN